MTYFFAVFFICFFVCYLIYMLYILRKGIETDATLIKREIRTYGTIAYTVDGKEYEARLEGASLGKKIGDKVRICYLGNNPNRVVIKGGFLTFKIFGLIFLIIITIYSCVKEYKEETHRAAHRAIETHRAEEAKAHRAIEALRAEEAKAVLKESRPIALSTSPMNWSEAKAFCQEQGGRLPLIGGSESLDSQPSQGTPIEGIGVVGGPWPDGLASGFYWTGTEYPHSFASFSWATVPGTVVTIFYGATDLANQVICVPK